MSKALIDKINESLSPGFPKILHEEERYYVRFFNSKKLEVELTLHTIDLCFNKKIEISLLEKEILALLLRKYNIEIVERPPYKKEVERDSKRITWPANEKFQIFNQNTVVTAVSGKEKSGKTTFVKECCNRYRIDMRRKSTELSIKWFDFNTGNCNIMDEFLDIISWNGGRLVVVLDHLGCCSFEKAKSVLEIFYYVIQAIGEKAKLILIEEDRCAISDILPSNDVEHYDYPSNCKIPLSYEMFNNLSEEERKIAFKVILIGTKDLKARVFENELEQIKNIIYEGKCEGFKLYHDGMVSCFDFESCRKILSQFEENDYLKIGGINDYKRREKDILKNYFENTFLDVEETSCVISHFTSGNAQNSLRAFSDLVRISLERTESVVVFCENFSSKKDTMLFGNHAGRILFAAEALSHMANKDWRICKAWKVIRKYIDEVYYVDGQKLPEIMIGKENDEKTRLDFSNTAPNVNSIEEQFYLQKIILSNYSQKNPLENGMLEVERVFDDDFSYIISDFQREHMDVDIDDFYRNYLLALLFEFEVTAPSEYRDENRIASLFSKVKINVRECKEMLYCYPARVPWVTARMILALCDYMKIADRGSSAECKDLITKMCKYLQVCSIRIKCNSELYRIWVPGTGKWNSVLETTMMCAFALSKAKTYISSSVFPAIDTLISEGKKYIKSQREIWFRESSIADGIWAYQTICLNDSNQFDLSQLDEVYNYLKDYKDGVIEKKNDKSLGDSHITNMIISLLKDCNQSIRNSGILINTLEDFTSREVDFSKGDARVNIEKIENHGTLYIGEQQNFSTVNPSVEEALRILREVCKNPDSQAEFLPLLEEIFSNQGGELADISKEMKEAKGNEGKIKILERILSFGANAMTLFLPIASKITDLASSFS